MVKLQEEILAKEASQLKGIRDRANERTIRFMDSRNRTIGIDKNALNQQVEEKLQIQLSEKKAEMDEAAYNEELHHKLEEMEILSQEDKKKQMEDVKFTLLKQMKTPKNNARKSNGPIDINTCGPSSLQIFTGSDPDFDQRQQMQKEQIKKWCLQQITEQKQQQQFEQEQNDQYATYVLNEDQVRAQFAKEEDDEKFRIHKEIQQQNLQLAQQQKQRQQKELEIQKKLEEEELHYFLKNPFLGEDIESTKSVISEKRVRPDHFKGLQKHQIQHIYNENETLLLQQSEKQMREEHEQKNWDVQIKNVSKRMEEIEYQQQIEKNKENLRHLEILEQQRKELKEKQKKMKEDKFGKIEYGFFERFGSSCR